MEPAVPCHRPDPGLCLYQLFTAQFVAGLPGLCRADAADDRADGRVLYAQGGLDQLVGGTLSVAFYRSFHQVPNGSVPSPALWSKEIQDDLFSAFRSACRPPDPFL